MSKIYIGDVGVEIRLDTGVDIDDATLLAIEVLKPDKTPDEWEATQYGTTQSITYTTIADDLDQAGTYKLQAYAEWGENSKHLGETVDLVVTRVFK
ncbi:MAG TPA: hypothetical protein VN455_02180 [Methanotrichaceae archaeon]|nr:hypothetical protein [Methanotrichaceae archaeon]